jgi:hypothetical protein
MAVVGGKLSVCRLMALSGRIPAALTMSVPEGRIQLVSATLSNLTNLRDQEVRHGDVADSVHGNAEGRAMGAMEERAKCCGNLSGAGKEEQDRR